VTGIRESDIPAMIVDSQSVGRPVEQETGPMQQEEVI